MMKDQFNLDSTLTCPHCGWQQTEIMPTNRCQLQTSRQGCGAMLRPNEGDCCVFCSFGSRPCPPNAGILKKG